MGYKPKFVPLTCSSPPSPTASAAPPPPPPHRRHRNARVAALAHVVTGKLDVRAAAERIGMATS